MAITRVQTGTGIVNSTSGTSASVTGTFTSNTAASGNLLIAIVALRLQVTSGATISATGWNNDVNVAANTTKYLAILSMPSDGGKSYTFNASWGGAANGYTMSVFMVEVSGLASSSYLDKTGTKNGANSSSMDTGATAATTQANEYVIGGFIQPTGATPTYSSFSGGAQITGAPIYATGTYATALEVAEQIVSATGAQEIKATSTATTVYGGIIATYKANIAATFLEPGGDATFNVVNTANGLGLWDRVGGSPTVRTDFVHGSHIKSIGPTISAADSCYSAAGTCADTGARISFWYYMVAAPNQAGSLQGKIFQINNSSNVQILVLAMPTTNVVRLFDSNNSQIGTDGPTLSTGQWYRMSFAYTITSTTVNRFELGVFSSDGVTSVGSISITNATIGSTGTSKFGIQGTSDTAYDFRASDFYIDNSSALTDPGNIWVTAKRPNANGTTNGFNTQIGAGGSGYGTGHSPQVNERPPSKSNGWSIIGAGSAVTEEYSIENKSTGDIDISTATIVDFMGWVSATSAISETAQIIVAGATSNISLNSAGAIVFTQIAGSSTYPAGNTDIGIITSTTVTTVSLYECGIVVAYIPAVVSSSTSTHFLSLLGVGS